MPVLSVPPEEVRGMGKTKKTLEEMDVMDDFLVNAAALNSDGCGDSGRGRSGIRREYL